MWGRRCECLLLQQLLLLLIIQRGCHCLPSMVEMLKATQSFYNVLCRRGKQSLTSLHV
jgi:hypothetical protein